MGSTNTWLGVLALMITTVGGVVTVYIGRSRNVDADDDGLPDAPRQPSRTWHVSPEMYEWFQEQMTGLHERLAQLEESEREQRFKADRFERLLRKALTHIGHQDDAMQDFGIAPVPMDPELVIAQDRGE